MVLEIELVPNMSETRYFSLARHALAEALRTANIRTGDVVALPEYICRDLLSAIHHVGATAAYYPLDEALQPISFPQNPKIKAIIAVNYFGFAQSLAPFYEYCKTNNAVVIEDNAHGFLSQSNDKTLLGTRGQFGITSIRKTLRISDGATLTINDSNFVRLLEPQLLYQQGESLRALFIRFLAKLDRKFNFPIYRLGRTIARLLRKIRTGDTLPKSDFSCETEDLSISAPRASSIKIIENTSGDREKIRRINAYKQVELALSGLQLRPVFSVLGPGTVPYGYPFFSDDYTARKATKAVKRFGFEIIKWPDLPSAVIENAPIHYKNILLVNFL